MEVLIIEDDKSIREILKFFISEAYHVPIYTATNIPSAILKIEEHYPSIILLDYVLEDGTCEKVVTFIRSIENAYKPKVILITAMSNSDKIFQLLKVDSLIKKPFLWEELQQVLETLCKISE